MTALNSRPANYQTALLIWFALGLGQILFLGIVCFIGSGKFTLKAPESGSIMLIISLVLCVNNLVMGNFVYRAMESRQGNSPSDVQNRSLVRWALFEGAAMFCLVSLLITFSLYLVPLIALMLVAHGMTKPCREQF